ncbi:benzoate/H(+) symporter BenE family transporter [Paenibacillus sp.]|uniref:benzoate/H(+) symporter BenE family transporter n=1 Tax=Paenibacillus sp. TaxID=58172 RepID=UPI002D2C048A|nr:benzoate/H(+) symporter BenE family transporter [Paenibacillus sp.]HZG88464.1 benzoate/H(+) symporter BenE family transporter [Paenibacillus sp.]
MKFLTTGIVSALLACTGGAMLLIQAAESAGLSDEAKLSWIFSVYVIGGLLNTFLTLKFKIPFAGAHSITGIAFIGTIAADYSWPVLAGGFVLSGAIIVAAGASGVFSKTFQAIPKPIIDALLAGLLLTYILDIVPAAVKLPISGILAVAGYFLLPRLTNLLSPPIWAMLMGGTGLLLERGLPARAAVYADYAFPSLLIPEFTWVGLFSIALPLSLLVMSNDLAVAFAALKSQQLDPPVNRAMAASGLASAAAGLFGGHAATVGGMMTALCSSPEAGDLSSRRKAACVSNGIVIVFGLFSWKMIELIQMLPASFVALMTGFSILGLFVNSMKSTLQHRTYRAASAVTFAIAALHFSVLGVSTPVWALLAGLLTWRLSSGMKRDMAAANIDGGNS